MQHDLVRLGRAQAVLGLDDELRRVPPRKRVENLLPHRHPVRRLDEGASPKQRLRRGAPQDGVNDGQEVDLVLWPRPFTFSLTVLPVPIVPLVVVNLLQLPQDHRRGNDALEPLAVPDGVEVAQRWDTLESVLDGVVGGQVGEQLALVEDALGGLVLWQPCEVAGGQGEDGVHEGRVLAGADGHHELEVSLLVAEVKLEE